MWTTMPGRSRTTAHGRKGLGFVGDVIWGGTVDYSEAIWRLGRINHSTSSLAGHRGGGKTSQVRVHVCELPSSSRPVVAHLFWNDSITASIVECVGPHAVIRIDADNVHSLDRQDTRASIVKP